jgi:hypothetical protein
MGGLCEFKINCPGSRLLSRRVLDVTANMLHVSAGAADGAAACGADGKKRGGEQEE